MSLAFRWWANPWFVLGLEAIFVTASEVLLKVGASETRRVAGWEWTGLMPLAFGIFPREYFVEAGERMPGRHRYFV